MGQKRIYITLDEAEDEYDVFAKKPKAILDASGDIVWVGEGECILGLCVEDFLAESFIPDAAECIELTFKKDGRSKRDALLKTGHWSAKLDESLKLESIL